MKRVMLFAYDGTGLGHLMRLIKIALGLSKSCKVVVVSGHKTLHDIIPEMVNFYIIPNFYELRNENGYTNEQTNNIRISILDSLFKEFAPDVFITDYLPYGKRCELANIITKSNCLKYFILRSDIGGEKLIHEDVFSKRNIEILNKYYKRILIASDPSVTTMEQYSWLPTKTKNMMSYIGFVTYSVADEEINMTRRKFIVEPYKKWMVCSAGGGKRGEEFIKKCIELSSVDALRNWKIDIIFGNYSSIPWPFGNVQHYASNNVTFHKWIKDLYLIHAAADCVVCAGGYNTLTETMQGICKRVFSYSVMNFDEEEEQVNNIRSLAKYYNIQEIDSLDMILETVLEGISVDYEYHSNRLNMDGIKNAVTIINKDLNNN